MTMKSKLPDDVFSKLPADVQKYVLELETKNLVLSNQNDLLKEDYNGVKKKTEIIKQINFISGTKEEKFNNLHFYEEGKIASLLWSIGLSETTNIKELGKDV